MKKCLSLFVFLSFLVLPGFSHALKKQADDVTPITMEEVVVTATRYEEKIATVPANVTVITERVSRIPRHITFLIC